MSESKSNEDYEVTEEKQAANEAVLKRAMTYCWSENFLGRFRRFFADNAAVFEDHAKENMAIAKTETVSTPVIEHNLKHMDCFNEYLQMFEETLQKFVEDEGSTNAEFYQQLLECQTSANITPEEQLFIQCLLASADYDSFYSVMVKEAKKLILMKQAGRVRDESAEAESKGGDEGDEEEEEKGAK